MTEQPATQKCRWICLLLAVTTLAIFWPVTRHDFINFDDPDYVTSNQIVQQGLTWEGIRWAFTSAHASNWHPLTWLSHMLDVQLFGLKPGWHHLSNLLLHAANALVLFGVLRRMTGALWRSALVAALFALHPLHVESVAWVAERKDVLSTFFWMLTLWAYARYAGKSEVRASSSQDAQHPTPARPVSLRRSQLPTFNYTLALVFFAFGLMSKPMLVTVPFVLLLLDYWPLGRFALSTLPSRPSILLRLFWEKAPFFALAAASSLVTFWAQRSGGAVASLELFSVGDRVANALVSYVRYLGKAVWPADLVIIYPHPGQWSVGLVAGAVLLLAGFTAAAIRLARRRPYLAVGWLWFLGTLVPVIGLVQVGMQAIADRYTYVPLIGIFIAVSWGIPEILGAWRHRQTALVGAATLALLLCAVTTRFQLTHWRNGETILGRAVKLTSGNFIAHNYLANAIALQGRFDEAISHYQEALRIDPKYADAYNNFGYTLSQQGKYEEAVGHYRQALRIKPNHERAHNNLGLTLAELGKFEEAAEHFAAVVRLRPRDADALYNLANALAGQGKSAEAVPHLQEVVRLKPDDAEAREKLGRELARQGKAAEAEIHFAEVLRLRPDTTAHYQLALALVMQGKSESAVTHYREAIRLNPDGPLALNDLAWLLATHPNAAVRNGAEAVRLAERACELAERREAAFLGTLDAAYAEAGRFTDAIAAAKETQKWALATGRKELAELAEKRMKLYEAGQPYRQQ